MLESWWFPLISALHELRSMLRWRRRARKAAQDAGPPPTPPADRGPRVIRVTGDADGALVNRGYAYWPSAYVGPDGRVLLFVGRRSGYPFFYYVTLVTGAVERLPEALIPLDSETEGWYFGADGWVYLCSGPQLLKVHPLTGDTVTVLDIRATHRGCDLWQAHSSDDGQVHSATVRQIVSDGPYTKIGTVVSYRGAVTLFGAQGVLDEAAVDRSGEFLIIKEGDDNRIIRLATGVEVLLTDAAGALGHSDTGPGFMVGENNQTGSCDYVDLHTLARRQLFSTWNLGYVSVRGGRCLWSSDTSLSLVDLQSGAITPLLEHGGGTAYDDRVKASLSPCGRVATYMSGGAVSLVVL